MLRGCSTSLHASAADERIRCNFIPSFATPWVAPQHFVLTLGPIMFGRPIRHPWYDWPEPLEPPSRAHPSNPWRTSPVRARTPRPVQPPETEISGDGDVPIRGKPFLDPSDAPTPLGSDDMPTTPATPTPSRDEQLRNALLELEESKKRLDRERDKERERVRADLVVQLLPVLDNLDRSIQASAQRDTQDPLREGVRMVRDQFDEVLQGFGLEVFGTAGTAFDPAIHEAMALVAVDDPSQHRNVMEIVRAGYRLEGRLLRAAQVIVGDYRAPEVEQSPTSEEQ